MRNWTARTVCAAIAALSLTGCGMAEMISGPSCSEFQDAGENEKQEMVLDWMKDQGMASEDAEMLDQGSGFLPLGFEVMYWVDQLGSACTRDPGARLGDFSAQ